jgi:hypothetical protein
VLSIDVLSSSYPATASSSTRGMPALHTAISNPPRQGLLQERTKPECGYLGGKVYNVVNGREDL